MKSIIVATISMLTITANAGVLTCEGVNPDNKQAVKVVVDSGSKTLSVDGQTESAQFAAGPTDDTLAVISQSAFVGISTKGYKEAMINTATLEQVTLKCDGNSL